MPSSEVQPQCRSTAAGAHYAHPLETWLAGLERYALIWDDLPPFTTDCRPLESAETPKKLDALLMSLLHADCGAGQDREHRS